MANCNSLETARKALQEAFKDKPTFLHISGYRAEVRTEDGEVLYWEDLPQRAEQDSVTPIDFAAMIRNGTITLSEA